MLRRTFLRPQALRENLEKSINRPIKEELTSWNNDARYGKKQPKSGDPDPLILRFLRNKESYSAKMFKARILSDSGKALFAATITIAGLYFGGAAFKKQDEEQMGMSRMAFEGAEALAAHSAKWWSNQWRKGAVEWRAGESEPDFFVSNFDWILKVTGRNMLSPPVVPVTEDEKGSMKTFHRKGMFKALVPLCGDSPIIRVLAERGYFVHGIECSEVAMQSLSRYLKIYLPKDLTWNIKLHWADFYDPELWSVSPAGLDPDQQKERDRKPKIEPLATDYTTETNSLFMPPVEEGLKGEKFDFIYDRQAMSTYHPSAREDYAFMLKRVLKDDGVLFVEGIFRTGRVKGNKVKGPPYGLSESQLSQLFPPTEGFSVKCDTSVPDNLFSLDKAHALLGSIPKELHSTPIPCVVWKPAMVKPN